MIKLKEFYNGKRVLVTGHTGFKGSWLCKILCDMGATVYGYALAPEELSLYNIINLDKKVISFIGDISDYNQLEKFYLQAKPDILFHLAAQPLVRLSYEEPERTYLTNVMGTVNILECIRKHKCVKSVLNVTTDKVYLNREWEWGYRENERLDGYDPYSNSKSCSELVTWTYVRSFFSNYDMPVISTARAGNVIGGGDFSKDRIIPDCVKAAISNQDIIVRNPNSTRPYQHVLEPLFAYLLIAVQQYENRALGSSYNVGPDDCDCLTTGNLVDTFVKKWDGNLKWINLNTGGPHEANFLKLDNSKIKHAMGWHPVWHLDTAIEKVVEWSKEWHNGGDVDMLMTAQISQFIEDYTK
ncbi:MAG: CDP-glucose 4,6-dehydratase [Muribaculum sp.]|nr:CDP-glucose 4,6-dehydratase [Muribaculum sp.]